jgi:3-hydroxyacyl-CoA dehydrogenase / 3-hydroxy-2-methylbutyryl-CoA dehydrogenase
VKIEGSVALVTGGVSGLGFGAATRFVRGGGSVVMFDIDQAHCAVALDALGGSARFIYCDVRDSGDVADAVGRAAEEWGRIDILVNAAGVAPAQRLISRDGDLFDLDLFKFVIEVNLVGMFDVTRHVAAVMARNEPGLDGERGVIVNVASIAAFEGQIGQAAYSASKGGIVGMTLPLARDLAGIGVRCVTVAPGIMDTPSWPVPPRSSRNPWPRFLFSLVASGPPRISPIWCRR